MGGGENKYWIFSDRGRLYGKGLKRATCEFYIVIVMNISVLGAEVIEETKIQFLPSRSAYSSRRDRCEKR